MKQTISPSIVNYQNRRDITITYPQYHSIYMSIAQLMVSIPNPKKWTKKLEGFIDLCTDNSNNIFINIYSFTTKKMIFQHELYINFDKYYKKMSSTFYAFQSDRCVIGLNFLNSIDASEMAKQIKNVAPKKSKKKKNRLIITEPSETKHLVSVKHSPNSGNSVSCCGFENNRELEERLQEHGISIENMNDPKSEIHVIKTIIDIANQTVDNIPQRKLSNRITEPEPLSLLTNNNKQTQSSNNILIRTTKIPPADTRMNSTKLKVAITPQSMEPPKQNVKFSDKVKIDDNKSVPLIISTNKNVANLKNANNDDTEEDYSYIPDPPAVPPPPPPFEDYEEEEECSDYHVNKEENIEISKEENEKNVEINKEDNENNIEIKEEDNEGGIEIKEGSNENVEIKEEDNEDNIEIKEEDSEDNIEIKEEENEENIEINKEESGENVEIKEEDNVEINKDESNENNIEIKEEDNGENIEINKEDNEDNIEMNKEDNKNIEINKEEDNEENIEINKENNEDNIEIKEEDNENVEIKEEDNENAEIKEEDNEIVEIKEEDNEIVETKEESNEIVETKEESNKNVETKEKSNEKEEENKEETNEKTINNEENKKDNKDIICEINRQPATSIPRVSSQQAINIPEPIKKSSHEDEPTINPFHKGKQNWNFIIKNRNIKNNN